MRIPASTSRSRGGLTQPLRGALRAALLIGVAQHAAVAHEHGAAGRVQAELRIGDTAKAVKLGEAAVARAPQDAALRAELGHAYLRAGRFESAAGALRDALALGDTSDGIALSLALAQIACGQNRAALATLDHAAAIGPADLGLALALAGDTEHGIAVLTDAVRDGLASPNLRQNLAYAYALGGRWADANLTAGFDLPPDQVSARLEQWAQSMQSGGERVRVARLLNVPLTMDLGMPAALALNGGQAASPPLAAAPSAPAQTDAAGELPPLAAAAAAADPGPPEPASPAIAAPIAQADGAPPARARFHRLAIPAHGMSAKSGQFVQLAAYHSRRSAERGRLVLARRHALLRGHGLLITAANGHGRSYWRVILTGFDGVSASSLCASLKRQGGDCFAYSVTPQRLGRVFALADTTIKRPALHL